MEFAINEKATRLQVIQNMPDMMQSKKRKSIKRAKQTQAKCNKKRNYILQWSLRLMMLKKTTNNNALAEVKIFLFSCGKNLIEADSRGFMTIFFHFDGLCTNSSL